MGVIKSKMGTIGSKIGRKFEQKRQAKWVKKKMQIWSSAETAHLLFTVHGSISIPHCLWETMEPFITYKIK